MKESLRLIIALVISFLVLFVFNKLFYPKSSEKIKKSSIQQKDTITTVLKKMRKEKYRVLILDSIKTDELSFIVGTTSDSTGIVIGDVFLPRYNVYVCSEVGFVIKNDSLKGSKFSYGKEGDKLIFTWRKSKFLYSIAVSKDIRPYFLKIEGRLNKWNIEIPEGIKLTESIKEEKGHLKFFYKTLRELKLVSLNKLRNLQKRKDRYKFIGVKNKYFLLTILNPEGVSGYVKVSPLGERNVRITFSPDSCTTLYLVTSPLDYDLLKSFHLELDALVSLGGWYRFISVIILKLLKFFYTIFKNYGIAIIVFALLMKLIFAPLSMMSHRSMKKMQMLQPKIEEIRKKYKDDPQRMNQEIMKLYQLYGVNPLSGCLPLLIQLPVFIALYSVLRNAIELRHAPFVKLFTIGEKTWLIDLSHKDPFYILPIAMGIAYLLQNLLTNPNPQQRWMGFVFPLIITFIFLSFPSGLQLYWFTFNILSIAEHFIMQRGGMIWKK